MDAPNIARIIEGFGLDSHFSPEERAFIDNPAPSRQDRIKFFWQYECAWVLLWALGYVHTLGKPVAQCDPADAVDFMRLRTPAQFLAEAKLRDLAEILDQADLIYRYRWAIVDARLFGRETPAGLDPDVAVERHHALNWLIGYDDQDWDDISTDT